jgi:excisionase family DNA binding protein
MTPDTATASPWLTIREVRAVAQVGEKLLYREVKAGRLRAARIGGRRGPLRVHRDWIDQWLEAASSMVEVGRRQS